MAYELTREQEAKIASLAIEYPTVSVSPAVDGTVKVTVAGRSIILDENGHETVPPIYEIPLWLPTDLVKRMLGAEVVDEEIAARVKMAYSEHAVGNALNADVKARIVELLATSEAVRECGLGPAPAEAR